MTEYIKNNINTEEYKKFYAFFYKICDCKNLKIIVNSGISEGFILHSQKLTTQKVINFIKKRYSNDLKPFFIIKDYYKHQKNLYFLDNGEYKLLMTIYNHFGSLFKLQISTDLFKEILKDLKFYNVENLKNCEDYLK